MSTILIVLATITFVGFVMYLYESSQGRIRMYTQWRDLDRLQFMYAVMCIGGGVATLIVLIIVAVLRTL